MAEYKIEKPSLKEIAKLQDDQYSLRRQAAKAHFYTVAKRWHLMGAVVASLLALASPLVLFFKPELGPLLGALAGIWIFLARILFEPVRQYYQTKGAAAQESFDCHTLGVGWNYALVEVPAEEDIRSASRAIEKRANVDKYKGWYPTTDDVAWPRSVIICQRSNAVWARRQHHSYAIFLGSAAAAWAILGILVAVLDNASLTQYLTTICLPSLPALLDAAELTKNHLKASRRRQLLERETDSLFKRNSATNSDLRKIQDQIYELRQDAPPVAEWFYRMVARRYGEDMAFAASERARQE